MTNNIRRDHKYKPMYASTSSTVFSNEIYEDTSCYHTYCLKFSTCHNFSITYYNFSLLVFIFMVNHVDHEINMSYGERKKNVTRTIMETTIISLIDCHGPMANYVAQATSYIRFESIHSLSWTPSLEWCIARYEIDTKSTCTMCYDEVGLCTITIYQPF